MTEQATITGQLRSWNSLQRQINVYNNGTSVKRDSTLEDTYYAIAILKYI